MTSQLTWLDTSREDQRRMRELLSMFTETESRDELGIGQVRDAFSDLLFPGTSTLQTRARYLLFIPWCYQEAEAKGRSGGALLKRGGDNERKIIMTLKPDSELEGLIGRRAGVALKTLPSALYSGAMQRYRIQLKDRLDSPALRSLDDASEVTDRQLGTWRLDIPKPPSGFPNEIEHGFDLTYDEASWLRDRIRAGAQGSLLEHLVDAPENLADADYPWEEPAIATADGPVRNEVQLAATFSRVVHGAALLYNLLVAEAYEGKKLTTIDQPVDHYRQRLKDWAVDVESAQSGPINSWPEVRNRVVQQSPRIAINLRMQAFLQQWFAMIGDGRVSNAADDADLRKLVLQREQTLKRAQSRFTNEKLLATWSGGSGSEPLSFRWRQVKMLVNDLHLGLEARGDAST